MDIGAIVSTNLRKIRLEKGFSLTKLSELSGVSKGMLSQIENNGTSPTINRIWKICAGLYVPYT
ncbi:MAG: helix-turn-helix transcriptional regulator, partial [Lentilactobacillus hilgardii]|uniref:helix-turn-helix domain-containing protein n=1 Tax=Lentilactobacillus hilgardii TaxID=1588 RepID=UPI0039E7A81E